MVMGNFATEKVDGEIVEAIDFMVERVILIFFKLMKDKRYKEKNIYSKYIIYVMHMFYS